MKKNFTYYGIIWIIAIAVFNIVAFVVPSVKTASFWVGYGFITAMFIIQLVCSSILFKQGTKEKVFLNIPIFYISFCALILSLVVGAVFMAVSAIPVWIAIVACAIITAFYAIAIISAKGAAEAIENVDNKVKAQTFFIKSLTVDAQTLMSKAQSNEAKQAAKKVYEAVRYSDPMSNEALASAESAITIKFKEFETAVINNDANAIVNISSELIVLINDRNQKYKLLK